MIAKLINHTINYPHIIEYDLQNYCFHIYWRRQVLKNNDFTSHKWNITYHNVARHVPNFDISFPFQKYQKIAGSKVTQEIKRYLIDYFTWRRLNLLFTWCPTLPCVRLTIWDLRYSYLHHLRECLGGFLIVISSSIWLKCWIFNSRVNWLWICEILQENDKNKL